MKSTLRRVIAATGVAASLAVAGPVASAAAATPAALPSNPIPAFTIPSLFGPGPSQAPGTCGPNQGLFPGIPNLGPTGPLGPLGAHGPLGAGHLPCGLSAFNLGPSGPLGPNGLLGTGSSTGH
jgi:hypothetical protein